MKWLKSTTQKSWVASCNGKQIIIPPAETKDNRWLSLNDTEWAEISALPVISSLIKAGGIMVLSEEPAELRNSIPALQISVTQLQAELDTVKKENATLRQQIQDVSSIDIEKIKEEAADKAVAEFRANTQQVLDNKQAELDEANRKYKQLEAEAKQALAAKDDEITKLEKKLKKAGE